MRSGTAPPLLVVRGDLALALPAAERLVAAIAADWGVEPTRMRGPGQPGELAALADDLRTYSMFASGKIVVATATGALADRDAAADILKEVLKSKYRAGSELDGSAREAALRLLQVVRLHDLDPAGAPAETVLGSLPDKLFTDKKGVEADAVRANLVPLLGAAVEAGLTGVGAGEESILADLLRGGLPERHLLVLVESAVAAKHPLVAALERRGGVADVGRLEMAKGDWADGLDRVLAELAVETGTKIEPDAARELARRTLRPEDFRRGGGPKAVDAESVGRLGAEYRKLAGLSAGRRIVRDLVEANVDDRGQGDGFLIPNALAAGDAASALAELSRRIRGADDPEVERLVLFAQLAKFGRQMIEVQGAMALSGVESAVSSYPRFVERIAPRLKGKLDGLGSNPLAKTKEYPLHRLYLAASRRDAATLARLPAKLLETERRLKGDSDDPDAALALLVIELARVTAPNVSTPAKRGRLR